MTKRQTQQTNKQSKVMKNATNVDPYVIKCII